MKDTKHIITINGVKIKFKKPKLYRKLIVVGIHLLNPSIEEVGSAIEDAINKGFPQILVYTNNKYLPDALLKEAA